jgi:hypothetical protein
MPPLHHGPHLKDEQKPQLVSAQSLPSGRVIGTVAVEEKSNEIPAARALLEKLGPLDGKLLMLDALHSCQQTIERVSKGSRLTSIWSAWSTPTKSTNERNSAMGRCGVKAEILKS